MIKYRNILVNHRKVYSKISEYASKLEETYSKLWKYISKVQE